jgi:hypothetical protein
VIYPHVVSVDGPVSTEEAGVQVGLQHKKQLVQDLLRVKDQKLKLDDKSR